MLICVNASGEPASRSLCLRQVVARRRAMLGQRFISVVAGLLLGLALLPASAPAIAHGLHREGHAAVGHANRVRSEASRSLVGEAVVLRQAASKETGTLHASAVHASAAVACSTTSFAQTSGLATAPSHSSLKSCGHAGGCNCCGANGGCCGMSCCAPALAASVSRLPVADKPVVATSASVFCAGAISDTLLRPPRVA